MSRHVAYDNIIMLFMDAEGRVQYCIRSSTVQRGNSLTILQIGMK